MKNAIQKMLVCTDLRWKRMIMSDDVTNRPQISFYLIISLEIFCDHL